MEVSSQLQSYANLSLRNEPPYAHTKRLGGPRASMDALGLKKSSTHVWN